MQILMFYYASIALDLFLRITPYNCLVTSFRFLLLKIVAGYPWLRAKFPPRCSVTSPVGENTMKNRMR